MTDGKEKRIDIRVTEAEREAIKAHACASGLSVAKYILQTALTNTKLSQVSVDMKIFRDLYAKISEQNFSGHLYELRKQGGNLNQIARNLNQDLQLDHETLKRIESAIEQNEKTKVVLEKAAYLNEKIITEIAELLADARSGKAVVSDGN